MLKLLGPVESWVALDKLEKLKLGMKVGFRFGRAVIAQMHESADALLGQQMLSPQGISTPFKPLNSGNLLGTGSALNRAIDEVFWIIIRVLLNIFIGGSVSEDSIKPESSCLKAFEKLLNLLEWLKEVSKKYYDMESLYIAARLSERLKFTKQTNNSLWLKESLKFISNVLISQRTAVIARISLIHKDDISPLVNLNKNEGTSVATENEKRSISTTSNSILPYFNQSQSFPLSKLKGKDDYSLDSADETDESSQNSASSITNNLKNLQVVENRIDSMCNEMDEANVLKSEDIAFETVRLALQLPNDGRFTWSMWLTTMEPFIYDARKRENAMIDNKLNHLGLLKHSEEVMKEIDTRREYQVEFNEQLKIDVGEAKTKAVVNFYRNFRDVAKFAENDHKDTSSKLSSIMEKLLSERGPWGSGVDIPMEVF
jgi:hypothetical protein